MRILVLWLGKIIYGGLHLVGRRGAALPGLIVLKLSPSFLEKSLSKLPEGVIVITGTNGKTTSTKMLAYILSGQKKVLSNPTGSNFIRGIVSTIIHNSRISGKLPYDIAVFELDEAYAARFVELYKPRVTIVTNIMRDQMDRFGEIDNTAKLIEKVVKNTTEFVILNRDDTRVTGLANNIKKPIYYFGVAPSLRKLYLNDDELHETGRIKSSNLEALAELTEIKSEGQIQIKLKDKPVLIKMAADTTFNYQNAVAVSAAALALGVSSDEIADRLQEVKPAFGRGEKISLEDKKVTLQLVKNPGGFRHALHTVNTTTIDSYMVAVNDEYADGRDVSWLWDVNFSDNIGQAPGKTYICTSGTRAADMALRLKYDDIKVKTIEPSLDQCLALALSKTKKGGHLLIFTTYTAMLHLRKEIAKHTEVEVV